MHLSLKALACLPLCLLSWENVGQAAPVDLDTAVRLAAEIGRSVNVLTRNVTTYHWQPRAIVGLPLAGEVDPRDPNALEYFRVNAASFWLNRPSMSMMGNGLYVATDPVASESFGGGDWALLAVQLQAGTRLLETRESPHFSNALRSRLGGLGCPTWQNAFEAYAFSYSPIPTAECAATFYEAIRLLGIQGVVYSWSGRVLAACALRDPSSMPAIVLNDPKIAASVRILVKEVPAAEPSETRDLRLRINHFAGLINQAPLPWPSLSAVPAPADLIEWIQSQTYFCDATHWEDFIPSKFNLPSAELIEKQEEISEKAVLVSAKIGRTLRPEQMRGVVALQYYTPAELHGAAAAERLAAPEFQAWLRIHTEITRSAQAREPLSPASALAWARGWAIPGSGEAPNWVSGREPALADLLAELNRALFQPRQASNRDKALLRDPEDLMRAYGDRLRQLAPLTRLNDRLARTLVDYIAIVRGWPPILIRSSLDEVSPLGAFQAILVMDKCLDRYVSGTAMRSDDCAILEPQNP